MSVLEQLFGSSSGSLTVADGYAHGYAQVGGQDVCVFATIGGTYIDNAGALALAAHVLDCVESMPGIPIVMLVDSKGQAPSRRAEMLGLASYFGHLLTCLELARQNGHLLLTVATGEAVGGAFVCYGMFADRIYALDSATVGLMPISAMAAVTKIPEETLEALSKTMPALEFGVDAFTTLGGAVAVWSATDDLAPLRAAAIADAATNDDRALLGKERGGRTRAYDVQQKVLAEASR
jgi:malonate decarboxylase gamma subunit